MCLVKNISGGIIDNPTSNNIESKNMTTKNGPVNNSLTLYLYLLRDVTVARAIPQLKIKYRYVLNI